jgi:hypothetical protein
VSIVSIYVTISWGDRNVQSLKMKSVYIMKSTGSGNRFVITQLALREGEEALVSVSPHFFITAPVS